jgi:competence protein ComEA
MPDMPRSHLVIYALAAVAVLAFGLRQVARADDAGGDLGGGGAAAEPVRVARGGGGGGALVVHVAGAVRRPGVYRVRAGSRVADAVELAGGARPRADLTRVNLAQELEDGRQVIVPLRPAAGAPAAAGSAVPTGPINLNTATLEQLDTLQGIGPATAQAILTYREQHGGFSSVEELDQVPGIGEVTMATLREGVTV